MTRTKKRGSKKVFVISLIAAMVMVLSIGGTLAYLSTQTESLTNSFTFLGSDNISATLTEPNWDPETAVNLTPGKTLAKDPTITNDCELDEYVAMRVTFQKGDGTTMTSEEYTRLMSLIAIDFDTTKWASAATAGPVTIYNFSDKLVGAATAPFSATIPLFENVTINDNLTNDDMDWLKTTIGGFNIYIEGAAIQGDGYADIDAAASDLDALFN